MSDNQAADEEAARIMAEHRECGVPKYDGCFCHLPLAHCRACGCPWPCDVERLRRIK